ncbi:GAF domain-containing protein, partial [Patescibacteria group bacterium]|nr:GAF domain-containing protein [Patescibacteria group bacterium]
MFDLSHLPFFTVIGIEFVACVVLLALFIGSRKALLERSRISNAIWKIDQIILNTLEFNEVVDRVVNAALLELSKYRYAILVLSLLDEPRGVLKRISISRTEEAAQALKFSPVPFNAIEIPITYKNNLAIRAMHEKKPLETSSFSELLIPAIDSKLAYEAQLNAGIKASIVYPVIVKGRVLGTLIFSTKKTSKEISWYEREIMSGFVDAVGIALENATLFQSLNKAGQQLKQANQRLRELDSVS